jgi:hypothetical protein
VTAYKARISKPPPQKQFQSVLGLSSLANTETLRQGHLDNRPFPTLKTARRIVVTPPVRMRIAEWVYSTWKVP